MPNRKEIFVNEEYYHIYNQGVDKRNIFLDEYDIVRFMKGIEEFNTIDPIGSLYQKSLSKNQNIPLSVPTSKLVDIISYCLNPNHFHFILRQTEEGGISNFMKKVLGGFSYYYNFKHKRKGPLFAGSFKAKHIKDNDYLLYLSVYVNLNDIIHQLSVPTSKLIERSSWKEYIDGRIKGICDKDVILEQFKCLEDYKNFAEETLPDIIERKDALAHMEDIALEIY